MVRELKLKAYACVCEVGNCRHAWTSYSKALPVVCPLCRSRSWNGKKKLGRPAKTTAGPTSDLGQQPKYQKVRQLEEL